MWLSKVAVSNCRIVAYTELELAAHVNVLYGDNASGKSSLLEALAVLSRGRSFRTPRINELITRGADELTVSVRVEDGVAGGSYPAGICKSSQATRIRINHADVAQQAELSAHIPLTLIHPASVDLVTGGPAIRRAFLDWIAFYRFTDFNSTWRNYQRILKQRNACLRDAKQRHALPQWTEQLIALQPILYRYRLQALDVLQYTLQGNSALLANLGLPLLQLSTGFPANVDVENRQHLEQFFRERSGQEQKQGFSLYGAHRTDLHILLDGVPAVRVASRGQLKLLAVALLLAQSHTTAETEAKRGIIAIDDLASELDESNQQALYNTLRTMQQQLIITGAHYEPLRRWFADARVFHVKQGKMVCQEAQRYTKMDKT
ncbi:DNA replication and repair protein RecF [Candidatus Thiothrix sp. Deng01]|uniref:DNA replication and repair protein RecF n=1 Tax=Candidatus Thiothrix phosphatis TaxID=3112415 RepID=A0ABU6D318_9GAMM|nr:DNA replication and repair protein RecF [Candidatus Thiothrix sp. Deng01]MEB4593443.1 DNA replication and repair protein RecF [Candidatus Thiothrix sp. Deng01]